MTTRQRKLRPLEIELNPPRRRLWDRMRRLLVGGRQTREPSDLRDVLLLLPDLTVLLLRLLRDDRVALGNKAVALVGVGYVLSPIDLIPGFLFGPFGLVDDVIVLSATLSRVVNHVHPDVVRSHWSGQGDALDAIQRVSEWSENQLGRQLPLLLSRLVTGGR
jgi:uncharacterized membrane protein YkvA (DUF1232 family)